MLALVGSRVCYRTIGSGVFHCERCGGDRPYRHRSGRRWAHLLGVPLALLGGSGEHLRCAVCRTCYRVELLAVPTIEQMLVALLVGTKAAVLEMLRAGGACSPAARRRAVQMIRAAGAPDYDDGQLLAVLANPTGPGGSGCPGGLGVPGVPGPGRPVTGDDGLAVGLRPAGEALPIQPDGPATEVRLPQILEGGGGDGPLTPGQRRGGRNDAPLLGQTP